GLGFAQLLVSVGMVSDPASTYQIRFWVSIVYLGFALSCVVGTNVYLFMGRRGATVTSAFSSAVTVPFLMVSALFISSFLGSGEVTFSPAAISTLAFLMVIASGVTGSGSTASSEIGIPFATIVILVLQAFVISLSVFGFPPRLPKGLRKTPHIRGPLATTSGSKSGEKEEWEESASKDESA